MEDNQEDGLDLLLGLDQTMMIDDQLSSHDCVQNADQRKFESTLKGL